MSSTKLRYGGYLPAFAVAQRQLYLRWGVYLVLVIGIALTVGVLSGQLVNLALATAFLLLFFTPFVPPVRRQLRAMSSMGAAMRTFATDNDMAYSENDKPQYETQFQPAVSKLGMFERNEQVVSGTYNGYPFETYVHTFRHPFDNRLNRVATRVYHIKLPKVLPHIFVSNRQADSKYFSNLMRHFDNDQRIHLEGNFEDLFTTYTHRRTATEALSILAPNVMQTLVDSNHAFDVEIVGDNLYLYSDDYLVVPEDMKDGFRALDKLLGHLEHRLKSWKFVLPNDKRYPYLRSRPGFGTVTFGGKYFNQSWLFIIGTTIWSLFKTYINQDLWQVKLGTIVVADIVMIAALLVFRRRYNAGKKK
jgi:hypothetical protein